MSFDNLYRKIAKLLGLVKKERLTKEDKYLRGLNPTDIRLAKALHFVVGLAPLNANIERTIDNTLAIQRFDKPDLDKKQKRMRNKKRPIILTSQNDQWRKDGYLACISSIVNTHLLSESLPRQQKSMVFDRLTLGETTLEQFGVACSLHYKAGAIHYIEIKDKADSKLEFNEGQNLC